MSWIEKAIVSHAENQASDIVGDLGLSGLGRHELQLFKAYYSVLSCERDPSNIFFVQEFAQEEYDTSEEVPGCGHLFARFGVAMRQGIRCGIDSLDKKARAAEVNCILLGRDTKSIRDTADQISTIMTDTDQGLSRNEKLMYSLQIASRLKVRQGR